MKTDLSRFLAVSKEIRYSWDSRRWEQSSGCPSASVKGNVAQARKKYSLEKRNLKLLVGVVKGGWLASSVFRSAGPGESHPKGC